MGINKVDLSAKWLKAFRYLNLAKIEATVGNRSSNTHNDKVVTNIPNFHLVLKMITLTMTASLKKIF